MQGIGCAAANASDDDDDAIEVSQTKEDVPAVSVTYATFLHTCEACCDLAQGVSASRKALPATWLRGGEETRTRGGS